MTEIWKKWADEYQYNLPNGGVKTFPEIYISNLGNIKGRKISKQSTGYYVFHHKDKTYKLHRIVAELFIPNPDNKPCIDHINTVRTDNRVENLRWCTYKENMNNKLTKKKKKKKKTRLK